MAADLTTEALAAICRTLAEADKSPTIKPLMIDGVACYRIGPPALAAKHEDRALFGSRQEN